MRRRRETNLGDPLASGTATSPSNVTDTGRGTTRTPLPPRNDRRERLAEREKGTTMPHNTHQPSSSLSRRAAVTGMAVTTAALGLDRLDRASAQEASPDAMATHPMVGAWMAVTPSGLAPGIFFPDGTVIVIVP